MTRDEQAAATRAFLLISLAVVLERDMVLRHRGRARARVRG